MIGRWTTLWGVEAPNRAIARDERLRSFDPRGTLW